MEINDTELREQGKPLYNKTSFPGYDKIATEQQKNEKQKLQESAGRSLLPPFFMVRAGVFKDWLLPLVASGIIKTATSMGNPQSRETTFIIMLSILAAWAGTIWAVVATIYRKTKIKLDAGSIYKDLEKYINGGDTDFGYWAKEDKLLFNTMVKQYSKRDPGIFNRLIECPESIDNIETAKQIILGHLKSNPKDAFIVLQRFDKNSLPSDLYRKLVRIQRDNGNQH